MEVGKLKPGAYFNFKVYSIYLPDRNIDKETSYRGYYFWKSDGENNKEVKETIEGNYSSKFNKIAEINLEDWKLFSNILRAVEPEKGTFVFNTRDQLWYEKNNFIITFIPPLIKHNFKIHIFRDSDNYLKCKLTTYYHKNVLLKFEDIDKLHNWPSHPFHSIAIMWNEVACSLFIDSELVDSQPKVR